MVAYLNLNGVLTERLGNGLQNRVERFDSARHLEIIKRMCHSFMTHLFFVLHISYSSDYAEFTEYSCPLGLLTDFHGTRPCGRSDTP